MACAKRDQHSYPPGMKLSNITTFVVGNPQTEFGGQYFLFVKVETDTGATGIGEIYAASFHPDAIVAMVDDVFDRTVAGHSPFDIETIWRRVYSRGYSQRPDPSLVGILSGIEIALWDIIGKETNQPVHNLIGGLVHPTLRAYSYLYPKEGDPVNVYEDADLAAQRALEYVDEGFTAVKFDPAGPYSAFDPRIPSLDALEQSELMVRKVRDAIGTRADILFGTHGQFTASGALRMARRIERYDPLWFEEPTAAEMPEEMAKVAHGTSIPIATGERLTTKYEFARVLRAGAASILQPALGRVGGISEAKKIAALAEVHYAVIAPHLYAGPVEAAANIQFAASIPNFLILESIYDMRAGIFDELIVEPLTVADGYVVVPTTPGLGIELNEEVASSYPYEKENLHLRVTGSPIPPGP